MFPNQIRKLIPSRGGHLKEVISGAGISLTLRLIGAACQFMFSVVIARMYGAEGFGIYTLALSCTVIASVMGRWGLDQAALKFIAIHAERGEWGEVRAIQKRALKLVMLISSSFMVLLFIASQWLASSLFHQPDLDNLLQIMIFSILPFSGLNLLAECMRAIKKISAYTVVQGVLVPTFSIAAIILFAQIKIGIVSAIYAYVISCWAAFLVAFLLWRRLIKNKKISFGKKGTVKLLQTSTPMAWVAIITAVMSFSEIVLLGIFRTPEEAGMYAAALRLALLINFIIVAFNSILASKFATLSDQSKTDEMRKLAKESTAIMLLVTSPLLVVFLLFPGYALSVFNPEFIEAENILRILSVAQLINIGLGPVGLMLMMTGHESAMRKITIVSWLVLLLSGFILIPQYGMMGAAWTSFIAIFLINILSLYGVKKLVKINVFIISKN